MTFDQYKDYKYCQVSKYLKEVQVINRLTNTIDVMSLKYYKKEIKRIEKLNPTWPYEICRWILNGIKK